MVTMIIIITLIKNSKYLILIKQIRSSFSLTFVIYQKQNQFLCLLYYYHYHYHYYIIIIIIIIIIISSMNIILLHYYLRAGILVNDTAILMARRGSSAQERVLCGCKLTEAEVSACGRC